MKKLLFCVVLFSASVVSSAQFSIGPKLGFGLSNIKSTGAGVTNDSKGGLAPTIGLDMKIDIVKYFSIQPSVQGQILGANYDQTSGGAKYRIRQYLGYIQIPVKFNLQFPISDKMSVGFGAGPYMGYFLAGAVSTPDNEEDSGTKLKSKANVTADDDRIDFDYINPLDYGVVLAPYFQVGVLNIAPTMTFGMNTIHPKYEGKSYPIVSKNVYYGLQLSFLFGGK
jgi:hypothetical protein